MRHNLSGRFCGHSIKSQGNKWKRFGIVFIHRKTTKQMVSSGVNYLGESDSIFHLLLYWQSARWVIIHLNLRLDSGSILALCMELTCFLQFPSWFSGFRVPGGRGVGGQSRQVHPHAGELKGWLVETGWLDQHLGFWIPV